MAKKDTDKQSDPTVTSATRRPQEAPPSSEADDYAGNIKYEDAPSDLKPGPDSVVQVEVTDDAK